MNRLQKEFLLAAVLGVLVPWLLLNGAVLRMTQVPPPVTRPAESTQSSSVFMMPVLTEDGLEQMPLSDYLTWVVLGEMPSDFDIEALKAQAVVARTYTLRSYESGTKHPGGAVCTESACCQGFCTKEEYLSKGGTEEGYEKIRSAVTDTADLVLTYGGSLIEATYFSSSGGKTEDALAVWGTDVPYLRATDSPEDGFADKTLASVTFTAKQFTDALGISLTGSPATWLGDVTYTAGGGVNTMVIGGTTYQGTTLRQKLGLRSTAFAMTAVGDHITVTTRGYGHRVGMSQYGAEAMAVQGKSYEEILAHYYQGTVLTQWIDKGDKLG
jgi:stage II sporulation protein D